MDKRYTALTLQQQLELRRQAVQDVLANQQWSIAEAIRHLKMNMRITTAELARLSGVSFRTLQDIERERSEGNVQTINRILSVLGLKLGVVRIAQSLGEPTQPVAAQQDLPH
ncbi:MAG: helix-turn-helix transcriptional regulator [Comamonadaceae bacterium]|nr:helix-turn-helix transcriptional regulator [Comamonadaceae bacterium]